jgi:chromosome segregation ATPase
MDRNLSTLIAAGMPTLAVIAFFVRNESSIAGLASRIAGLETRITSLESNLNARLTSLEARLDARIETLDRDLRDWAKITMQHNSDISRLKDKAGLD